jgi:Flp pilus assembly protein TadG
LRREAIRGEQGQTLILFVFALPLLLALIALVSDGSNLFANKRSVQNVSDATVLAAVRELNPDLSLCTGPPSTAGTCLNRVQTVASDYSNRNAIATVDRRRFTNATTLRHPIGTVTRPRTRIAPEQQRFRSGSSGVSG